MSLITIEPTKTYATAANAIKAVEKAMSPKRLENVHYIIAIHTDGRFYPLFIGNSAIEAGVHFNFNVVN